MAEHLITPPEATVLSLRNSAPQGIRDAGVTRELWLINRAYAAGADQELEACCKWLYSLCLIRGADELRAARRPKPPSLKEQALTALDHICVNHSKATDHENIIRRALEALSDD